MAARADDASIYPAEPRNGEVWMMTTFGHADPAGHWSDWLGSDGQCSLSTASVAGFQSRPRSTKQMATSRRVTNFRMKFCARSLPTLRQRDVQDKILPLLAASPPRRLRSTLSRGLCNASERRQKERSRGEGVDRHPEDAGHGPAARIDWRRKD